jgi:hypothetical protein
VRACVIARACMRACVDRFCVEHMSVRRELILNHVGSARARGPHRRRTSAGAEFGAWRNSPTPSPRDGGRAEKGQTTKGHPHDGKMLYFSKIRMPMNGLQAVVSVFEPLTFVEGVQAHEDLQRYKADCERRLQLSELKAAEARVCVYVVVMHSAIFRAVVSRCQSNLETI